MDNYRHWTWKETGALCLRLVLLVAIGVVSSGGGLAGQRAAAQEGGGQLYLPMVQTSPSPPSIFGWDVSSGFWVDSNDQDNLPWIRLHDLEWSEIEAVKGTLDWSAASNLEKALRVHAAAGRRVILTVRGTPTWARRVVNSPCSPIRTDSRAAFAAFMHAVVMRYSAPPYNVLDYEIWNEPDMPISDTNTLFGCWGDFSDEYFKGGDYARVLQAVYPAIKSANPHAQVLAGSLSLDCNPLDPPEYPRNSGKLKNCKPAKYFEGVLVEGGGDFFDGLSFHAYDYYGGQRGVFTNENWKSTWNTTGPTLLAKAAYLRNLLVKYQVPEKYMLLTEVALICTSECGQDFELTKADYLVQAYTTSLSINLKAATWYDLFGSWRHSGLVSYDMDIYPAYHAYQFAFHRLGRATFLRTLDRDGLRVFEFLVEGRRLWVVWSQDGSPHTLTLATAPSSAWDMLGQAFTPSQTLEVDYNPVYLEWPSR